MAASATRVEIVGNFMIDGVETATKANDVNLVSSWSCLKQDNGSYGWNQPPSTDEAVVAFPYSLPSGANILSSNLTFTRNNPTSGISRLTLNGGSLAGTNVSVSISGTSGVYTARFNFTANGTKTDTAYHTSSLKLGSMKLVIVYEQVSAANVYEGREPKDLFPATPQSVCIYNQANGEVYTFDGVMKVQHNLSSKFEEDPEKKKEEFVNGARNEPDKVVLDVVMSDVYTTETPLTKAPARSSQQQAGINASSKNIHWDEADSRSAAAAAKLHELKEKREKLMLITQQYVYVDMILGSVTISQDENCPFGWEGQLTFQSYYKTEQKSDETSSKKVTGKGTGRNASLFANVLGTESIDVQTSNSIRNLAGQFSGFGNG